MIVNGNTATPSIPRLAGAAGVTVSTAGSVVTISADSADPGSLRLFHPIPGRTYSLMGGELSVQGPVTVGDYVPVYSAVPMPKGTTVDTVGLPFGNPIPSVSPQARLRIALYELDAPGQEYVFLGETGAFFATSNVLTGEQTIPLLSPVVATQEVGLLCYIYESNGSGTEFRFSQYGAGQIPTPWAHFDATFAPLVWFTTWGDTANPNPDILNNGFQAELPAIPSPNFAVVTTAYTNQPTQGMMIGLS